MSLARMAARICATRALQGQTIAEDRVFDSAIDPIDETVGGTRKPVIVVTTDDDDATIEGRSVSLGEIMCDLVIEIAIAGKATVQTPGGSPTYTMTTPATDAGTEVALDMLERQVVAALTFGRTTWGKLWMDFVPNIHKINSRRGAASTEGVRFAARQIVMQISLVGDPVGNGPVVPGSVWEGFLAACSTDTALRDIGAMLQSEIAGETLTDWQIAARQLGIPIEETEGLGIAPEAGSSNATAPALSEVDIAGQAGWPNGTMTGAGYASTV